MIERIAVEGYRSIRSLVLGLDRLNVVTGPNGCGKSNLYRAIRFLSYAASGDLFRSLALEGGFGSALWAGPETISNEVRSGEVALHGTLRKKPISLKLGVSTDELSYCIDLGLPQPGSSIFSFDPEIKREFIWEGSRLETKQLRIDRKNTILNARDEKGKWKELDLQLPTNLSMLSEYADPYNAPEIILMKNIVRRWRFYDSFRVDSESPARKVSIQTFTPALSNDGQDLAAALGTILEIGDREGVYQAVDDAFPGTTFNIISTEMGFELVLNQPGLLREISGREISDGMLRYFLLLAALNSPRPAELLVLNEPESSLHPDLIPPLANMILRSSERSQIIVVTHSHKLVDALSQTGEANMVQLEKSFGETRIVNQNLLDHYSWKWPRR